MATTSFEDFYEVPDLNFDILRLKTDLDKILEDKKFNSPGVTHFGAIPINQIPNDENSIKGNNIRGKYWTIADDTGKEVSRDVNIDESKYTQLVPEFEKTYFKEVFETLKNRYKLGREALIETILLSKCDSFIFLNSNISSASMAFNLNPNQKKYKIDNGFNSKNIFISMFYWYLKKILPNYLWGFKNTLNFKNF